MNWSARHLWLVPLLLVLRTIPLAAQEQPTDFYIVDGKKIQLTESVLYQAVRVKPGMTESVSAFAAKEPGLSVQPSPILDRHNVVLIKRNPNSSFRAFRGGVQRLSDKSTEVVSQVPVYAIGGIDQVLVNEFKVQFRPDILPQDINEYLAKIGATVTSRDTPVSNRYIIQFPERDSRDALSLVNGMTEDKRVSFAEPNFIRLIPRSPPISKAKPASPAKGISKATASPTPDDPNFSSQWALSNSGLGGVGKAGADIGAPKAWKLTTGNETIIVAIIDEGVDTKHPDLKDKIVTPFDAVDENDDQEPNPWDAHGTACAGIAAAHTHNALGVAGVSWGARIMPIRIAYSQQEGGSWQTDDVIIERGLRTATARGANVLSNSWGGGSPSSGINSAIDDAIQKNRVVVFAAGNRSGAVDYPASLAISRPLIVVSATNQWDEFKTKQSLDGEVWGSNFGDEVWISAPGVHISTTDISGPSGYDSGDYTSTFNGTSSATPFVAGAVALLLSVQPDATPTQVRAWLKQGAKQLAGPVFSPKFGHGRLDIAESLRIAIESNAPKAAAK